MNSTYRLLTPIKNFIEELGFNLSYPYDDLIFIDSNAFLIQFDDSKSDSYFVYFNSDMDAKSVITLEKRMMILADVKKIKLQAKGKFQLSQKEGSEEEIEIKFF